MPGPVTPPSQIVTRFPCFKIPWTASPPCLHPGPEPTLSLDTLSQDGARFTSPKFYRTLQGMDRAGPGWIMGRGKLESTLYPGQASRGGWGTRSRGP